MTNDAPLRLFHLSDIHFGLEDPRALAWAEQCIAGEAPAAVVVTGDLTMRARRREFAAACAWIRRLKAPVTVEVGNHDLPYFNLAERFLDPYRRFRAIEALVDRRIDLGGRGNGAAIVPLKTTARAQWRLNWSKGWVTEAALAKALAAIDALPAGTRVLVAAHHPLVEVGTRGTALTRGGERALRALAERRVLAVLTGHVHDPFDLLHETAAGPVRMIGAGTLSKRIRSTPPSFNELTIVGREVQLRVRNLEAVPTPAMQIPEVPADALPPRSVEEPVAPVGAVPVEDPPVH
jgi:predicted MPP superfamily phosphohydrolase